jgi:hypothetical protein
MSLVPVLAVDGPPPVRLAIVPAARAVVVGEEIAVEVVAETEVPVSHFPLRLRYDPALLEVARVEAGGFLGRDGEAVFLSDASAPGEVVLGASRVGDVPGVAGRGVVARLVVRALAPGEARIGFGRSRARGRHLEQLPLVRRSGRLLVVASPEELPSAAPEPRAAAGRRLA